MPAYNLEQHPIAEGPPEGPIDTYMALKPEVQRLVNEAKELASAADGLITHMADAPDLSASVEVEAAGQLPPLVLVARKTSEIISMRASALSIEAPNDSDMPRAA